MKILFIANGIVGEKPGVSGGEVRFIEIAKSLARAGHQIHLLAGFGAVELCRRFNLSAKVHINSRLRSKNRWVFFFRFFQALLFFPVTIRKIKFDIIYSTSEQVYDCLPAWKIKRKNPRTRWATAAHWLPPWPPWKRTESTIFNSFFFFLSERLGLYLATKKSDILLPISEATAKQLALIGIPRDRYVNVECGVMLREVRNVVERINVKCYDAVFMKRLQAVKGIFDLIDIWEEVIKKSPQARLAIIGSGIDGEKAREIVHSRGLDQNIIFLGVIYDFKEKFEILAQSRIFVLPTHEENWAIVIGEAMAAGLPVIAYNLKELQEVWQDSFIAVPKGAKKQFAQKIIEFLDNSELLTKISKRGLNYVKRYDWKNIAEREIKIIQGYNYEIK